MTDRRIENRDGQVFIVKFLPKDGFKNTVLKSTSGMNVVNLYLRFGQKVFLS